MINKIKDWLYWNWEALVLTVITVTLTGCLVFGISGVIDYVKEHGLKSVIEPIWNGINGS